MSLLEQARNHEGFTLDTNGLQSLPAVIPNGYGASYHGMGIRIGMEFLNTREGGNLFYAAVNAVDYYLAATEGPMGEPLSQTVALGGWYDADTDEYCLDQTRVFREDEFWKAMGFALANRQKYIWDFGKKQEIPVLQEREFAHGANKPEGMGDFVA